MFLKDFQVYFRPGGKVMGVAAVDIDRRPNFRAACPSLGDEIATHFPVHTKHMCTNTVQIGIYIVSIWDEQLWCLGEHS